jgi:hypothetical protein
MRLRSLSAAAGFAAGLLAIYFVPTGGWPLYVVLVLAVQLFVSVIAAIHLALDFPPALCPPPLRPRAQ